MVEPTQWPGALPLPGGSVVRGRGLRRGSVEGPDPELALYLGAGGYHPRWAHRHLAWPDFWLPVSIVQAVTLLGDIHEQGRAGLRVEVACRGGRGRTGTALAAMATLGGLAPDDAVRWVRQHYDRHAVETPWQRTWVRRFQRHAVEAQSRAQAVRPAVCGEGSD